MITVTSQALVLLYHISKLLRVFDRKRILVVSVAVFLGFTLVMGSERLPCVDMFVFPVWNMAGGACKSKKLLLHLSLSIEPLDSLLNRADCPLRC